MKRHSLLIQVLVYVVAIFLLLLGLVGGLYYQTSSKAIRETTQTSTQNTISQSGQFILSYLEKLKQTTSSLAENPLLRSYAENPKEGQEVQNLLETILSTDRDLMSAVLVTKSGQVVATDSDLSMETSSDMMAEKWYQDAIQGHAMPVVTPAHKHFPAAKEDKWVISVTQEVVDEKGQNLAVLRLDIDYQTLQHYLDSLELGKKGFVFIVNSQHDFVYHPEKSVYSSSQEMAALKPYLEVKNGYVNKDDFYVYQYQVPQTDWVLIGVASLENLESLQDQVKFSFIGIGLVSLGICLLGIAFVLRLWIRPLRHLQATILAIGQGNASLRAEEKGAAELVDLAQHFNLMLDEIDRLMLTIKEEEQLARRYELAALSSQINPHFLYNTLDTIVWMAEFNDSQKVVEVTKSLAKYFRLALNQGNELIALKDELDHVRQYLFIQKQRYGDKLSYEIEENPAFDDFILPKLVLQPLVENAIYHGIKESPRPGLVKIKVKEEDNQLLISIYDNGRGFAVDRKNNPSTKLGGVGLKNVDERLKLQFGEAYRMSIFFQENQFTEVKLYLPLSSF